MSGLFYPEFFLHYLLTPTLQCLVLCRQMRHTECSRLFFSPGTKKTAVKRNARLANTHKHKHTHVIAHGTQKLLQAAVKLRWLSFFFCLPVPPSLLYTCVLSLSILFSPLIGFAPSSTKFFFFLTVDILIRVV